MIRLTSEVLPENRQSIETYIAWVWRRVTVFVQSIKREEGTYGSMCRFEPHISAEETRLQRNLEDIQYRIDGSDTFPVIAGEGRVEMVIQTARDTVPCTILT
jgi:hypothetical protein